MKHVDVILYPKSNSQNLLHSIGNVFSSEKFVLYEIDRSELISKCWYDTFNYLVIDSPNHTISNDKELTDIINEVIKNNKRVMLFLKDMKLSFLQVLDVNVEVINENIVIVKMNDSKPLIMLKTLESLQDNIEVIMKAWDLPSVNVVDDKYHSDVYVIANSKAKCSTFLKFAMNTTVFRNQKTFDYNNFKFNLHFPNCESDVDTCHKLLASADQDRSTHQEIISFNPESYFLALQTKTLGQIVLYSEVLASSFDLIDRIFGLTNHGLGLIIISKIQTQGKGRGTNKWISQAGCAMFTCSISIDSHSTLGKYISLVQHVMAVSIVESLCSQFQINEKDLKVKWPNDIYWVNHGKISGIISKASSFLQKFNFALGCGVNVSNSDPSICLHDIMKESNVHHEKYPSTEVVIAGIMNFFELNISTIQSPVDGLNKFKEKYYKHWMHKDQRVTVKDGMSSVRGRIIGISDYGYLEIVDEGSEHGSVMTLHPDGNSFDMMNNLIVPKR